MRRILRKRFLQRCHGRAGRLPLDSACQLGWTFPQPGFELYSRTPLARSVEIAAAPPVTEVIDPFRKQT
jgi:hypothetical protein